MVKIREFWGEELKFDIVCKKNPDFQLLIMKNQLTTIRDPWGEGHCLLFELLNKPQALEMRFGLKTCQEYRW